MGNKIAFIANCGSYMAGQLIERELARHLGEISGFVLGQFQVSDAIATTREMFAEIAAEQNRAILVLQCDETYKNHLRDEEGDIKVFKQLRERCPGVPIIWVYNSCEEDISPEYHRLFACSPYTVGLGWCDSDLDLKEICELTLLVLKDPEKYFDELAENQADAMKDEEVESLQGYVRSLGNFRLLEAMQEEHQELVRRKKK